MTLKQFVNVGLKAASKGEPRLFGAGASAWSSYMQRMNAAGSNFDYASEAGKIYDNGVVLPAINWKANAISECRLIVQKRKADDTWEDAGQLPAAKDAVRCIANPNDYYDDSALWRGLQLSWDVRGNGYWLKRRDNLNRLIGFYWVPHMQIRPMMNRDNEAGTKLVTHYMYKPYQGSEQPMDIEDVVHVRYGVDPLDPKCGLSPLAAEFRDICADNEVSTWLAALLRNGATPGVMFIPKPGATGTVQAPTPGQKSALKELWDSFRRDKRGEAMMVPMPVDVVMPAFNPQQMELGKLRDIPTARICAALGGDPMVFGLPSDQKTYSNLEEATDACGKRTILPAIKDWAKQIGRQVLPEFGMDPLEYRFWWDVSDVSWLQDEVDELHTRWREDFKVGGIDRWTFKEKIGVAPDPGDKDVYTTDFKEPALVASDIPPAPDPKKKALKAISDRARARRVELERAA